MYDILANINSFQDGNAERCRFASAVLGSGENVSASECNGDAFFLDGRWLFEALLIDALQQLTLQKVVFEVVAFGRGNILPQVC